MKVAELKHDKTVEALAKRLLKESPSSVSAPELAASLLRLNPHLSRIDALEEGTAILLPPELASDDASALERGSSAPLIAEAARALEALRAELQKSGTAAVQEIEQAQAWLKGETGKQVLREVPELKEDFSKTAAAATELRKEQSAVLATQVKLLAKLQAELASFLSPAGPSPTPNRNKPNERKKKPVEK
jgi:hypothetical protein